MKTQKILWAGATGYPTRILVRNTSKIPLHKDDFKEIKAEYS